MYCYVHPPEEDVDSAVIAESIPGGLQSGAIVLSLDNLTALFGDDSLNDLPTVTIVPEHDVEGKNRCAFVFFRDMWRGLLCVVRGHLCEADL